MAKQVVAVQLLLQEERDWLLKTFSTAPFSTAPAPVRVIVSSPLSSGPSSSPVVE